MPLADHDYVVKAFPTNRANRPLGVRVLPGRAGRNYRFSDAQCLGLTRKSFSINLRAVHSAVGCSVTLKCTSRRRLWVRITSTNNTRKVAGGNREQIQRD